MHSNILIYIASVCDTAQTKVAGSTTVKCVLISVLTKLGGRGFRSLTESDLWKYICLQTFHFKGIWRVGVEGRLTDIERESTCVHVQWER